MAGSPMRPGTVVDGYEVQEYLGRTSAGPAYRGYDRSLSRSVTIVGLEDLSSPATRERFTSEAPKLAALRHPHVVEVVGFGENQEVPYLVYDHVGGGSLPDLVRGRGLGHDEAVHLLSGIAGAVDEAHRAGVLHGDLEPANVLLSAGGEPLVTGFGVAPLLPLEPRQRMVRSATDAAGFIAPEEAEHGEVSAAADRYSFAGIAYEVLTGSPPFEGQTSAEVLNAQLTRDPPSASSQNPELGPATDRVLRRGLSRQPEARWPSCTLMKDALAEAMRSDSAPVPAARRGGRGWLVAGVAVLLIALVGLGALLWSRSQQTPTPTPGIALSDSTVQQGGSLIVTGSQLPANQVGTVQLESSPRQIGAFQADTNGNVTARVTIPEDAQPGGHVVSLCWDTCHASAKLTVTERPPTPAPSATPTPTPSPSPQPTPKATPTPPATPTKKALPSPSSSPS
jgi:serine/threonine-protein kinase